MDINKKKELELYIHIPFCVKKCSYCDFLSGPASEENKRQYFGALRREIRAAAENTQGKTISTVFIGGGTPSLSPCGEIARTMELLFDSFSVSEDAEITIETNPGTLSLEKLREYKKSGINRLSIGCQSVHENELRKLGRIHTFTEFKENYFLAREEGFTNINVDLISGLPDQTLFLWEESLKTIAELSPEHISAYSLIIEEGTLFDNQELNLPDEDLEREMYRITGEILQTYGYRQYEISNYAKKGYDCRHNIGYWKRIPYLGFGIGAASLFEEERFSNETDLNNYIQNSGSLEKIRKNKEKINLEEQIEETMILGLRMRKGIDEQMFLKQYGKMLEDYYGKVIEKHINAGFLEKKDGFLRLTEKGIDVSNPILADFLF